MVKVIDMSRKIHKAVYNNELKKYNSTWSLCRTWIYFRDNVSIRWKTVTCKNCINKREPQFSLRMTSLMQ